MASAPSNDQVFYAGGHYTFAMAVTKSTDGGNTWTRYILPPMVNFTKALAVDPTNANIVYAGGDSVLFKSTNGGSSWTNVFDGLRGSVAALAIGSRLPGVVFAGTQYGIYRSSDGGITWSNTGLSNVSSIALDLRIFAGTSTGVYKSTDFGASWSRMNQGLLDSNITSLDISEFSWLYAGTASSGVWGHVIALNVDESTDRARTAVKMTAASPTRGPALITYSLPVRGKVRIEVFDAQGRLLKVVADGTFDSGTHTAYWTGTDQAGRSVPSGIYFCQFSSGGTKTVEKLVFLK